MSTGIIDHYNKYDYMNEGQVTSHVLLVLGLQSKRNGKMPKRKRKVLEVLMLVLNKEFISGNIKWK